MQVSMRDIEKKKGIFGSKMQPGVALNVTFTPEELQIIERYELHAFAMPALERGLEFQKRAEKYPNAAQALVRVGTLVKENGKDFELWFSSKAECEIFKTEIKDEDNLQGLRNAMDTMAQSRSSEQFEL